MSDSVRPQRRQPTRLPSPWDSPGKNTGVGCHFLLQCMKVRSESEVAQPCPTLSDPMDCSLPGSSIHGIFQARVLEWGAIAFSAISLYLTHFSVQFNCYLFHKNWGHSWEKSPFSNSLSMVPVPLVWKGAWSTLFTIFFHCNMDSFKHSVQQKVRYY